MMDYPLHYGTEESNSNNNSTNSNNNNSNGGYRSYAGVFNDRPDIMLFENNSTSSPTNTIDNLDANEENRSQMLMLSTRPHIMNDPWNAQHPQLQTMHNDFTHNLNSLHHNFSQSERGIAGFVSKLYQCLQSTDTSQKYARWCQHDGKDMFIIDCIPEFTEIVLPRLFKHCKFPSFVRQLNIYGFQRDTDARKSKDTKDKESCRWYHPYFKPGRRDLFHLIRRKATRYSRKKRVKTEEDPETILNLGSGDESEEENMVLLVNQNDDQHRQLLGNHDERRCSSSASSVNVQPIEYNNTATMNTNQFYGDSTTTTPTNTNTTSNLLLVETTTNNNDNNNNTNNNNCEEDENNTRAEVIVDLHHITTPTIHSATTNGTDMTMREQELRLQMYHMKKNFADMREYFKEKLNTAHLQIDEQNMRIQQLEKVLAKQSNAKLKPAANYIPFNPSQQTPPQQQQNYMMHSTRLLQRRSLYDLQQQTSLNKSEATTPRPTSEHQQPHHEYNNQFYFPPENNMNKIVQIKSENDTHHRLLHTTTPPPAVTTPTATTTATPSWHFQHDNSIVAAGSNNESILDPIEKSHNTQHRNMNYTYL